MQIITNVVPTRELEAAVAAELQTKDKKEIAIAELLREADKDKEDDQSERGPRDL